MCLRKNASLLLRLRTGATGDTHQESCRLWCRLAASTALSILPKQLLQLRDRHGGVLTQYQPMTLNWYIGIGSAWDLDRHLGGVSVLPPYVRQDGGEWYKGTANAIYQNLGFIAQYDPDYVLVLSGDHIYKMDYSQMLQFHKAKQAAATIAVIEVP